MNKTVNYIGSIVIAVILMFGFACLSIGMSEAKATEPETVVSDETDITSTTVAPETTATETNACETCMIETNTTSIFITGEAGDVDEAIFKSCPVSEIVEMVKSQRLDIHSRNNCEMVVDDSTKMEFINQFGYCEPQTVNVLRGNEYSDKVSVVIERPYDGGLYIAVYTFDQLSMDYFGEPEDNMVTQFDTDDGHRYAIFTRDGKFHIIKVYV